MNLLINNQLSSTRLYSRVERGSVKVKRPEGRTWTVLFGLQGTKVLVNRVSQRDDIMTCLPVMAPVNSLL